MSMSCREVGERLLLFRDNSLAPAETEWLRQHLHECPNCITLLDSYEEVVRVLERLKPVALPPGALDRIRKRLEEEGPSSCC
jgi:Putative zinc-finger